MEERLPSVGPVNGSRLILRLVDGLQTGEDEQCVIADE